MNFIVYALKNWRLNKKKDGLIKIKIQTKMIFMEFGLPTNEEIKNPLLIRLNLVALATYIYKFKIKSNKLIS